MDKKTDMQFTEYLRDAAEQAKKEINYYPGFFHRMLNASGGYQTAVKLLDPKRPVSEGFTTLWEAGLLRLSVEALVLDPKWSSYFSQDVLNAAKTRLMQAKFDLSSLESNSKHLSVQSESVRASTQLEQGTVYTRDDLRERFKIVDATLDTGIFQPAGFNSIWLFVTEEKTLDRTQYEDKLEGDILRWQGQLKGRKDAMVIEHEKRGLELMVFYRRKKYEHPHAGFRYEGVFKYVSHEGSGPTTFKLQRQVIDQTKAIEEEVEKSGGFDPKNVEDGRRRVITAIVQRRGQTAFRAGLLSAYAGQCPISDCDTSLVLEAAHIFPYRGNETNHVTNGILLRSDLHTLFDLRMFSISGDGRILTREQLSKSTYSWMSSKRFRWPKTHKDRPSLEALAWQRVQAGLG